MKEVYSFFVNSTHVIEFIKLVYNDGTDHAEDKYYLSTRVMPQELAGSDTWVEMTPENVTEFINGFNRLADNHSDAGFVEYEERREYDDLG